MKNTSLSSKTVRPGLMRYSFYSSDRQPSSNQSAKKSHKLQWLLFILVLTAASLFYSLQTDKTAKPNNLAVNHSKNIKQPILVQPKPVPSPVAPAVVAPAPVTNCSSNSLNEFIKISISQRHLWACEATKNVYDTPVVTGIEYLAADRTPRGSYYIDGKYRNLTLTGSDSTGSWNDPVSYWMPFLHNQYGGYGFHDASWRSANDFGNIDPNSANASHGCIELPIGAAGWLYQWAPVGTKLTIVS